MPFDYDPKDAESCWPEGDYDAVLVKVEDKTSKLKPDGSGGNPMQVLTWKVYHNDGRTQSIEDYITRAGLFKLKQLARALGKEDQFKAGKFQADHNINCRVTAEIIIEQNTGFDDKNKIGRLKAMVTSTNGGTSMKRDLQQRGQPVGAEVLNGPGVPDDDIPF